MGETFGRGAQGFLVGRLQLALGLSADGGFGPFTEKAVMAVQRDMNVTETGLAGTSEFGARGLGWPSLFERCLNLTGVFEGTGFEKAEGRHETGDSAGVTFGIVGFTSYNGEVQELLRTLRGMNIEAFAEAGNGIMGRFNYNDLVQSFESGVNNSAFADRWVDETGRVKSSLKDFLRWLGNQDEMIALQMKRAEDRYWSIAVRQADVLFSSDGVRTMAPPRAMALLFDIAVQDGGLRDSEIAEVQQQGQQGQQGPQGLLLAIADAIVRRIARHGGPVEDVRSRKMCIATGSTAQFGAVHGDEFDLGDYAL